MSHWTTIETQFTDLVLLAAAAGELGLPLEQASQDRKVIARGYGNRSRECDAVIRCRGPYDVAVDRGAGGSLALSTDWWGGHVEKEVGANYGRLRQAYTTHATLRQAQRQGYSVRRRTLQDGSVVLHLNK